MDDDLMQFADDEQSRSKGVTSGGTRDWCILIVDDEKDVHRATKFALRNTIILERPLSFVHAYSSKEAMTILQNKKNTSFIQLLNRPLRHNQSKEHRYSNLNISLPGLLTNARLRG